MKTILNLLIAMLLFFIWCDIEQNSTLKEPNYSNTILCLGGIIFFGFFRVYWDEFLKYVNKK